mmetsp:Transcript_17499/g.51828  ORF Transcript_17499/g.51828 Transcript_17499/m.51828 type:complete len:259 (-) Transcript_17499:139-915(-)
MMSSPRTPVSLDTISDRQLTNMSLKRLQSLMDTAGMTVERREHMKARRRKLQNRMSAKESAARKHRLYAGALEANTILQAQVESLQRRNHFLEERLSELVNIHRAAKQVAKQNLNFQREIEFLTNLLADQSQSSQASAQPGPLSKPEYPPLADEATQHHPEGALVPTSGDDDGFDDVMQSFETPTITPSLDDLKTPTLRFQLRPPSEMECERDAATVPTIEPIGSGAPPIFPVCFGGNMDMPYANDGGSPPQPWPVAS